nr:uncharacterized protein LOC129436060 isoform X9 [Misgurnus anguillicaudatus]
MSGKAWMFTLFTTALLITSHVHYAQSECYPGDLVSHLYEELLEDHWFQIKKFSDSKVPQLLSVINTLCSTWIKNRNLTDTFKVVKTFKGMLEALFKPENVSQTLCEKYICTDGYTFQYVNKSDFGLMYNKNCKESVKGLTCPSKSMPPSASATTSTVFTSTPTSTSTNSTTSNVSTSTPPSTSANSTTSTVSTSTPTSTSANSTTSNVSSSTPPSTSANSTTSNVSTSTPTSTSANSTTSTVPTSTPPSTSANMTTSTVPTSTPPSTSANSTTSNVSTSTPPSTSANSTTSNVSTSTPPSTSANSTTSNVSTSMPPSTSANSTTSNVSTSTPPSTSANSTTSTDSTSTPPSTSANSTTSNVSTNLSAMASAATVTPSQRVQEPPATMRITIGFLGVTLLLSLIFYLVCKQYKKQGPSVGGKSESFDEIQEAMVLSSVISNENKEQRLSPGSEYSNENRKPMVRQSFENSKDSVV